jgi:FlaA1/EpsC-like NDP-sugar epimerase
MKKKSDRAGIVPEFLDIKPENYFTNIRSSMVYTPKNILITGACGFIGSHVCKTLVNGAPSFVTL